MEPRAIDHQEDFDNIIQSVMRDWNIDEDTASSIVANEMHELMDLTMFITADGIVYPCDDKAGLEKELLEYAQEGAIGDVSYIFIDGVQQDVTIFFVFKIKEKVEEEIY